ncbi:two-component regulator propeller domain-containing protein [Aquimarina brevivitae]|uniref:Two component regulator with propeller domain n=1 Tax=Aquimarina brevivitae TaxID=323412 RepID=A0A4Q7PF83_9FLAO|nr:two-component regulator propeller domain-containing protein [Aquimarina brevivitae]RZS99116.1 two component regulator with propeller domain [Aquimarina brevivitae]
MRLLKIIILVLFPLSIFAQNFENQWTAHYSYFTINDVFYTDNTIHAIADNSVFIYDVSTGTSQTITSVQGLSGDKISSIYYSTSYEVLVLGYTTGTIQVVFDNGAVSTFVDILNKPTIAPTRKSINQFYEYQDVLFIATGFGVVEFNLSNIEFGDTFFIGPGGSQINITGVTVSNNQIFVSSSTEGLLSADVNSPNLVDFTAWNMLSPGALNGVYALDDQIVVWENETLIRTWDGNGLNTVINNATPISAIKIIDDELQVTSAVNASTYSSNFLQNNTISSSASLSFAMNVAIVVEGNWYLGTQESGLLQVAISDTTTSQSLSPSGPLNNDPFVVEAQNDNLWVVYGAYSGSYNPFPLQQRGISRLQQDQWINIPKEQVLGATSLSYITINPEDPEEVFISSFQDGLLQIQNNEAVQLYNTTNSGFETLVPGDQVVRLNGAAFKNDGDLWITNARVNNGLKLFDPETAQTVNVNLNAVIPDTERDLGFSEIELDRAGNVFLGTYINGIVGYRERDGRLIRISGEAEGANLPSNNVQTLEIDQNNQLWVGTSQGIRVVFNISRAFDDPNPQAQQIIILDNEGVPQELLFDQFITDIEVDGANNKWVATSFSGVFYLSADGQETLQHFTKSNSPLPSNNVLDVTIDDSNGAVYFATENGLLEYKGTATGPTESLNEVVAFPNPVRPGYTGRVTIRGLTSRANVKITDIEGNLVYEEVSQGGSIQWDTRAFGKHKVASGVYLILITAADATETTVTKLLIVR